MGNKRFEPKGHIKDFLKTQLKGLTGHIENAGYPFNLVEWGQADILTDNENPSWWVYEQTAYWLDGYIRCAILLEDEKALAHGKQIIYNVFSVVLL